MDFFSSHFGNAIAHLRSAISAQNLPRIKFWGHPACDVDFGSLDFGIYCTAGKLQDSSQEERSCLFSRGCGTSRYFDLADHEILSGHCVLILHNLYSYSINQFTYFQTDDKEMLTDISEKGGASGFCSTDRRGT